MCLRCLGGTFGCYRFKNYRHWIPRIICVSLAVGTNKIKTNHYLLSSLILKVLFSSKYNNYYITTTYTHMYV